MHQMLRTGSTGQNVKDLQKVLNFVLRSQPPLVVDGIFGPKTYAAVTSFQRQYSLSPDGIVGPLTSSGLVRCVLTGFLS